MIKKALAFSVVFFSGAVTRAFATDASLHHMEPGEVAHATPHSSGGLPQLDPSSFASQIFWLFIVFFFMYLFFSRKTLPEISGAIEHRRERVQSDLETAGNIKSEVSKVQKEYEKALDSARVQATSCYRDAEESVKKSAEDQMKIFHEKYTSQILETEKHLSDAMDNLTADMNRIAADIALETVKKITGVVMDEDYVRTIVEDLNESMDETKAKAA